MSQYSESSVTEVIISGSVAVLVFKTEIVAVSLYAVRDHDPEPILWRRTLSSDGKPQFRNGSRRTFADDVFYYRLDQARAVKPSPELFVGPILGDRIFIRNGSELSCVDLLSSQTLWSVTAKINNGVTIAQNGQVALVSPESDFIEVFDLYDGQMRETKPWEPGFIWTSTSSSVLTSRRVAETQGRRNVIELSAPLGDQPKLQTERQSPDKIQEGDESTYGRVVGKRWLFLTSRDGKITVWDLLNHREIVSEEFAGFDKLNKMHGAQIGDQLIVLADQLQSVDEPKFNQTTSEFAEAANQSHYGARGVFAFDVVTGKLRWKREFKRPWGCTTMQPAGTPLLILTRSRTLLATSRGTPNKREMDMLGLDINTGETLLENIAMDVPVSTVSATQTTLLPLKNQMLVTAESSIVTLEFGGPEENDENAKSSETSGSKNTPETPREPKKGATPEDD